MPDYCRYIGIDYSGAETPDASLKGLRVYLAQDDAPATEVLPPPSPRKYWTRKGIGEWLVLRLSENIPTIVGIDRQVSLVVVPGHLPQSDGTQHIRHHKLGHDWPETVARWAIENLHRDDRSQQVFREPASKSAEIRETWEARSTGRNE